VPIRDLVIRLDTGRADRGEDMKLMEMFSAIGAPKEENQDIDWLDDLKFFIDNDNTLLNKHVFPAIVKHEKYIDRPDTYKLYLNPVKECMKIYVEKFNILNPDKKFTKENLIDLSKRIAEEQKKHILRGDYDPDDYKITKNNISENKSIKITAKSSRLNESVSMDSAIKRIVGIGDSIAQVYSEMKTMAEKWINNNGTLKGFHKNAAGIGKRWYDTFYWNKMESDLRTILEKNPKAAGKLQDFFDIERDERGHISFRTISENLPAILNLVANRIDNQSLKSFASNWLNRQKDYENFLDRIQAENSDDEDDVSDQSKKPKDNVIGRQNAAAEDMVNQILGSINKKAAGEIRNIIAREPNKLQALQRELTKRNIKVGESLDEDWRKKLAAAGLAGMIGLSGAAGAADRPSDTQKQPIVATIVIDGEAKTLDLTPKGFDDVRDAERWLKAFLKERGIIDWQAKIERSPDSQGDGTGRYQRLRIMGAGGLESVDNQNLGMIDEHSDNIAEMFDPFGPVSNLEYALYLLTVLSIPVTVLGTLTFKKVKNQIAKMGSRNIIKMLSKKQIKVDRAKKFMLEKLLDDLRESLDKDDGGKAKEIALQIKQIAKDSETKNPMATEDIRKVKGGYRLVSKKTGRNLGTYPTRAGAVEREKQVQYFKHKGK